MERWRARTRAVILAFGRRVRERRLAAGLTQTELGIRAHMRKKFVGEIERGTSNPSLESMALVAGALDCNVSDLLSPGNACQCVPILDHDRRRAQEALAVLGSILKPRKRASSQKWVR